MGISTETIRKITIEGEGHESLDTLAASIKGIDTRTKEFVTTSKTAATVTDMVSKRQLSAAESYRRQTLAVVDGARAQDQYTRAVKVLDRALAQGVVKTTADYERRLNLLKQRYGEVSTASRGLTTVTNGLGRSVQVASGALGAFGVTLGAAAVISYGKSILKTTADLQEQTDQILGAGGNVEALQALRAVFQSNGVSQEQGDKILQKLTLTLGEAAEGSEKAQDAFHRLGLGSKDLAGSSADAALPMVAKKLLEIEDASKRAALESEIFGKSGQQLESALVALAVPMSQTISDAKALGLVYDKELADKADKAMEKIERSFQQLSVALAPYIVEWVKGFTEFTDSINGSKSALDELLAKMQRYALAGGGAYAGIRIGTAVGGVPGGIIGGIAGGVAGMAAAGPSNAQLKAAIANYNARLGRAGLSPSERSEIQGRRDRAMVALNGAQSLSGVTTLDLNNRVESITSTAKSWALTDKDVANAKKIEESRHHVKLDEDAIKQNADELVKSGVKQLQQATELEHHAQQVAYATDQYIESLQTEVGLAGMSADERERQEAILEGIRISEGKITDAQKGQIAAAVDARQEAMKWQSVVTSFEEFPDGFTDRPDVHQLVAASIGEIFNDGF